MARTHFTVTDWLVLAVVTDVALAIDLLRVAAELREPVIKETASDTTTAKRKMCNCTPEGFGRFAQNVWITLTLGMLQSH